MSQFSLSLYDYELPKDRIAQASVQPHHSAQVMVVDKNNGQIIEETTCWELDRLIPENRVLFFNDSKVLPARLTLHNAICRGPDGGEKTLMNGEIFFLGLISPDTFEALVHPGKIFKDEEIIEIYGRRIEVIKKSSSGRILRLHGGNIIEFFETYGALPLPPYVEYAKEKEKDYQSIFAEKPGSVAAPTASLHFTEALIQKIQNKKETITLHIGLGTFQGVKTEDIRDFEIHEEMIQVDASIFTKVANLSQEGKKVLAVGTTVTRSLESLPYLWDILPYEERGSYDTLTQEFWNSRKKVDKSFVTHFTKEGKTFIFSTKIYIYEGFELQIVEDLITNFHLPKSSLLILIGSILGKDTVMKLYTYAVERKYRFFSFGDAMYIRGK